MKRYLAVIWPKRREMEALLIAGYERDGKIIDGGKLIGFAADYYEGEALSPYGRKAIIGDYATRQEAEDAIGVRFAGAKS
jgi:hypothetical protein